MDLQRPTARYDADALQQRCSFHEAGHAIACLSFGVEIIRVTVADDTHTLDVDMDTVRMTLETNALAPFHLAQVLVPLLRLSEHARIVNVSSGMGAFSEMEGDYAAYRLSKTAQNAISVMLATELQGRIAVNATCPGWVKTDMGGRNAEREVSEGADTPVWLALDAPQTLTGKFLRDRKVIPW
jgi:NAD(P)-dependent dehydrogenase (short-subunit alcohol dehydrogenase family)